MKIFIDETELDVFSGARVKDALRKYSQDSYKEVSTGMKTITDKNKNPLDLDGELTSGQQLHIMDVNKETAND